jgi:hypothetical protein
LCIGLERSHSRGQGIGAYPDGRCEALSEDHRSDEAETRCDHILLTPFNHQTHHRCQVHAALTQSGIGPQPLDVVLFLGERPDLAARIGLANPGPPDLLPSQNQCIGRRAMSGKTGANGGGGKRREPGNNPGDEAAPGTPGAGESVCPVCRGSGRSGDGPCENCGGSGRIIEGIGGA